MIASRLGYPNLGLGVGLRSVHFNHILQEQPAVDWFEVISENFIDSAGRPRYVLEQIAERYPVVMHGVSLSIGSTDPLNFEYLAKLKRLAGEVHARWISDHLCWTGVLGMNAHDLLPLPLNEESLAHVVRRVRTVQDFLERPLVLENPSSYVTFANSSMSEWEFLSRMSEETDCGLLLDVNNVYVSSVNHEFDPLEYIQKLPQARIVQMHLAGHTNCRTHLIDTHDNHVTDPVWELYRLAHERTGGVSSLLEWDAKIPPFPVVHAEVLKARQFMAAEFDSKSTPTHDFDALQGSVSNSKRIRIPPRWSSLKWNNGMKDFPLNAVQRWLQSIIVHPGGVRAGLAAEATQSHLPILPHDVSQLVPRSSSQTSIERLAVYANAYYARLIECLESEFPVFRQVVGEDTFAEFAAAYLQQYPSQSYSLGHLGDNFPRYLAETKPLDEAASTPGWADFLVELAQLERVFADVFDGLGVEGNPPLLPPDLQAIDPDRWAQSQLHLVPCFRLLVLQFPLNGFYTAAKRSENSSIPEPAETWLAVTRRDFIVRRYELIRPQFALLRELQNGKTVGDAIAASAEFYEGSLEQFSHDLREWFADWAAAPFFAAVA